MIVLIGESACGKSSIERVLVNKHGFKNVISYTTRPIREKDGEQDGITYHYITKEDFLQKMQDGFFAETTYYNDNYYGAAKEDCTDDKVVVVNLDGLHSLRKNDGISITSFHIKMPRRTRLIKALLRGDDIDLAYKRSVNDALDFASLDDEVDFIIENDGRTHTIEELAQQVLDLL